MATRAKCEVEPRDLVKILRGNINKLDPGDFLITDTEQIVINYSAFLCDLFSLTRRPTTKLLEDAASLAFERQRSEARSFAQALVNGIALCRNKVKSFTTGKKQHPAVFRVLQAMKNDEKNLRERSKSPRRSFSSPPPTSRKSSLSPGGSPAVLGRFASNVARSVRLGRASVRERDLDAESRRADVFASFGLSVPVASRPAMVPAAVGNGVEEISDSDTGSPIAAKGDRSSSSTCQPLSAATQKNTSPVEFIDSSTLKLVRQNPDGSKQVAEMFPGRFGFMLGRFPGDSAALSPRKSEIPNILYEKMYGRPGIGAGWIKDMERQRREQQVMKKPAGRAVKAKVESTTDNEKDEDVDVAETATQFYDPPEEDCISPEQDEEEPPAGPEDASEEDASLPNREAAFRSVGLAIVPPVKVKRAPATVLGTILKCVFAKTKSYIVSTPKGQKKQSLLVNVTDAMAASYGKEHSFVLAAVFDKLVRDNKKIVKSVAVEIRDDMLAN